ncbi:GNAT family N-acetyltransferase [Candidatus Dojkabacteria bacterium]|nr:GNAT family N-acetyltransferase [Candidatus Dojkabacteria bacterium]
MRIEINNNIDIAKLEELFTACFDELKGNDSQDFTEEQDQAFREWFGIENLKDYLKFSHIIIAHENNKFIGGAIVGMQNPLSWPDGKKYEFFILGLLPGHRNKGLGKRLVQTAEKVSKENGARSLIVNTHVLMKDTQHFYENLGFSRMGTLKNYYGNGDAVFLSRHSKNKFTPNTYGSININQSFKKLREDWICKNII